MARGFKVADVYAELHLDRDMAREALRGVPAALGGDADRAGRELGQKVTDGLARAVEAASARVAKARRAEVVAADAVKLAELRLSEAREKGGQKASTLLALEQKLSQAQLRLAAANSTATTATNKHADAQRRLSDELANIANRAGPDAERSGRELGGKLSQGIHLSIVRNSPLIAAALGAGLALGAPVMMSAATGLFAGIGIVSAAQSEKVQSAWLGTWQRVKAGAVADAAVIEPTLIRLADRVGDRFERMRPQLQGIFADAAPQIEVFADGILDLAENALPGLERSVARSMPVTQGLADLLRSSGTGLSDFFDRISAHAPEAGQAFSSLGDIIGTLLPIIGEVAGQGAELAAVVLPLVSRSLDVVLTIVDKLGPALPAIAAGFGAMKIAQSVGGWVGGAGAKLTDFAAKGGLASGAAGKVGSALSYVGRLAGPVGIGIGVITSAMAVGEQQTNDWAQALLKGGAAAAAAYEDMGNPSFWDKFLFNLTHWGNTENVAARQTREAKQAVSEMYAAMTPLELATAKVAEWTNTLSMRLADETASTGDVEAAKRRLAHWQAEAARLADNEARAIRGVTEAMVEQADQSRALVDAQFGYERSLNAVEDAAAEYQRVMADGSSTAEDQERALLGLNEALSAQAQAARRVAEENLPAAMDDSQRAILGAKAELDELNKIAAQYELPPQLEAHRQKLIDITGQADGAMLAQAQLASAVSELGFAVAAVPGEKHITITAPTDELRDRLADLGFTILELPNGDIEVRAETAEAQGKVGSLSTALVGLNNQRPMPVADLDDNPLRSQYNTDIGFLTALGGQRPTPIANLNAAPLHGANAVAVNAVRTLMGMRPVPVASLNAAPLYGVAGSANATITNLNNRRANPLATLYASTGNAEGALNYAARNRVSYVTQYVSNQVAFRRAGGASGGKISDILGAARGFAEGGTPHRRSDGKLSGPGGPLDDLIPAISSTGEALRVANQEWIIKGLSSLRYGDRRMAAINDGVADVRAPGDPGYRRPAAGFADGGTATPATSTTTAVAERPQIVVQHLEVRMQGAFDIRDRSEVRRFAQALREELIGLERETS